MCFCKDCVVVVVSLVTLGPRNATQNNVDFIMNLLKSQNDLNHSIDVTINELHWFLLFSLDEQCLKNILLSSREEKHKMHFNNNYIFLFLLLLLS